MAQRQTVAIVPGLAVSRYMTRTVEALTTRGIQVWLCPGPGRRGTPVDLAVYADEVLPRLLPARVDAVVGLSVGCLAAAVAVQRQAPRASRLVLVSPVVEPEARRLSAMLGRWAHTATTEPPGLLRHQVPDWLHTSPARMLRTLRSSFDIALEDILPGLDSDVVIVHAERDRMTSHRYAARLAAVANGRLELVPQATHSFPFGHEERFAGLVEEVLSR